MLVRHAQSPGFDPHRHIYWEEGEGSEVQGYSLLEIKPEASLVNRLHCQRKIRVGICFNKPCLLAEHPRCAGMAANKPRKTKKRADTALLSDRFQSSGEVDAGDFFSIMCWLFADSFLE